LVGSSGTAVRHLANRPGTLGAFLSSKRADLLEVTLPRCREHHLNTVKQGAEVQNENWVNSIARKRPTKALCPLLSIESHFGKLAFYH
jgi:hypothetical protein